MVRKDNTKNNTKKSLSSSQLIPVGFLLLILAGTLLLCLPFSTVEGEKTSVLTALFTATTSTCVTGLVVVNTFSHWTLFGQAVILMLIQFGGMGIVAITALVMILARRKLTMANRVLLMDSFNLDTPGGVVRFLRKVFVGVFIVESIGALLYSFYFIPVYGFARGIWYSFFHSISAFCNAGIDLLGENSLIPFQSNLYILTITMALIVLGGLGYIVWFDLLNGIYQVFKKKKLRFFRQNINEHTKLVLVLTVFLIVSGAFFTFIMEYSNPGTIGNMSLWSKLVNSLFQSVTLRTAGFAAVPQENLTESTAFLSCFYMFIGGSPMGTAGGVKTVTFFVLVLTTASFVRGRNETVVFRRAFSVDMAKKATAIVTISFAVTMVMTILLMNSNNLSLIDAMYEMFSATATVGLSRNVTSSLNAIGRILVIVAMYLGRIGPISMVLFFNRKISDKNAVRFAKGKYFIG
ncbi:TrkH family potassium uptake protein [Butyrivibrio sp. NC3005]|uniref:TrkH family potassium uptake protein n=1 Tax=Butyrivibrio sp. NC3005 TaxID=1280685 RepID=UPI0006861C4C|nr:potassium transporter TrkG [Butyrivibrio sp. NC3005]